MRGMRFAVVGLLVVGTVSLAQAQLGPKSPGDLLTNKAVQEDLKLSEDQITKLDGWRKEFGKTASEILKDKGVNFKGKLDAEMMAKMNAANVEISKQAYKQLADVLKKEQIERLKQIQRQQLGTRVFMEDTEVVETLKLTAAQKDSVKVLDDDRLKVAKEMFLAYVKAGKFDPESQQENQRKVQKLLTEVMGKMEDLLDDKQKVTWKELKGEPFDVTKLLPMIPKK